MSDSKRPLELAEVEQFCAKPYARHGARKEPGATVKRFEHDWATLVETVSAIERGQSVSKEAAEQIAAKIRKQFPNDSTWDAAVASKESHEIILNLILAELPKPAAKD